jgi:hypothetical protein
MRKRWWIQEYRCSLFGMNILKKVYFCKEINDEKCTTCNRGNEDGLKQDGSINAERKQHA